ncbi:MAG: ABC transporter substrate-binding protein, partial [Desulfobulbaceae bacterium]|nr:ABC transporter substrate-binding protein [Desulfobulbaceae bacterium]
LYEGPTPKDQVTNRLTFLEQQKIDLLFSITTPVTIQAQKIFTDSKTPIVFAPVFSPVDAGLVNAETRCGKNITGVMVRGSTAKSLGYLMECLPNLKTIFVPFHSSELPAQLTLKDLKKEADKFGINILTSDVSNNSSLEMALQNIPKQADAIWMTHSRLIVENAPTIILAATKLKIPVISPASQYRNGALLSYAPNPQSMGQQAGKIAAKVLNGIDASKIPVEQAEYFLGINLVTARELGIEIRNDILREADFIKR